jgi:hypothetical protein
LKVGAETHIFFHPAFIQKPSKSTNFKASSSSQKISTISVFSSVHTGAKHLMFGSKHTVLSFFGLDIVMRFIMKYIS